MAGLMKGVLEVAERTARQAAKPGRWSPSDFNKLKGAKGRQQFADSLEAARGQMDTRSRLQVSPIDPKTFKGEVYMTSDGKAGFAIAENGEVVGLFGSPDAKNSGVMDAALTKARAEGATHLHAFDNLAESYGRRGARETERYPWDQELASRELPEWDPETMGTPDYVRMDIGGVLQPKRTSELSPVEQAPLPRHPAPRGEPALVAQAYAPENVDRLRQMIESGVEQGGDTWYHLQDLRDKWVGELGDEAGNAAFDRFAAHIAATSPRSNVPTNLKRAGFLQHRYLNDATVDVPPEAFPAGYGHMAHRTAHAPMLQDIDQGLPIGNGISRPKATSFYENVRGNYEPLTADSHHNLAVTGRSGSPTGAQYPFLEQRAGALGREMGLSPAETQSAMWVGAKDLTGVHDARGLPEGMNQRVARTAEHFNIPEEEALRGFMRGDHYLRAGVPVGAATLGAGMLASPDEAEAGPIGAGRRVGSAALRTAEDLLRKSTNDVGRFRRGGQDGAQTLDTILARIEQVQGLNPRAIKPEDRARIMDELYAQYQEVQGAMDPASFGGRQAENWQREIPGEAPMLDDVGVNTTGETGRAYEDRAYRVARPYTPEEAAELTETERLASLMETTPWQPTNNAQGHFWQDPWYNQRTAERAQQVTDLPTYAGEPGFPRRPEAGQRVEPRPVVQGPGPSGAGRAADIDERGFVTEANPHKRMYGAAGAAGLGVALNSEAEDPGMLAGPTMSDDDGRITARGALDAWPDSRVSGFDSPPPPAAEPEQGVMGRLGDLGDMVGGIGRNFAGMIQGGLQATGRAAGGVLANEIAARVPGLEVAEPADIDELVGIVERAREDWGGISEDNRLMQDIAGWIQERPWIIDTINSAGGIYERGAEKADEYGPEAGVAYRTILQGLMEII